MSSSDPNFAELMKKQKAIQTVIEAEYIRHHTERDENPNLPKHKDLEEQGLKIFTKSELPPSSEDEKVVINPTKEVQDAMEK
jgi:hypothetical protein